MIERYTRPAMGGIWTEENKYRCWLQVESAASTVLAEDGVIPAAAAEAIATKATVSAARVAEIEAEVKHDVIAFTTAVAESLKSQGLDAESRWLHYGLTSNDIVDTAQALQVKEASALIKDGNCRAAGGAQAPRSSSSSTRPPSAAPTASTPSPPPSASSCSTGTPRWSATPRASPPRPRTCASASCRALLAHFGHLESKTGGKSLRAPRPQARAGGHAGHSARPARRLHRHARQSWAARSTKLPSRCAICNAPRCARRRSTSAKSKKAPRPCRTRRIPLRASKSAAWRACCAAMRKRRSKIFRCGTSATSRIPPSSA